MSSEIKTTIALNVANGDYKYLFSAQPQIDQTSLGADAGIVQVGTSAETISFVDITTEGVLLLQNLEDSTGDSVNYGPSDGTSVTSFAKIKPGEVHLLRMEPGAQLGWNSDGSGGTVKINFLVLED